MEGTMEVEVDYDIKSKMAYLVTDCETGGFEPRINPLLSIALVAANTKFEAVDTFDLKIKPPAGTLIEIPIEEHQLKGSDKKSVEHYMDVFTGQLFDRKELSGTEMVINARAAEINSYVTHGKDGLWDMDSISSWNDKSMDKNDAERAFIVFVHGHFKNKPVGVAHNSEFDERFVKHHMPTLYSNYYKSWFCTYKSLRKWRAKTGEKGSSKLGDLVKCCNYVPLLAHDSFEDAKSCLAGLKWLTEQLDVCE